MTEQDEIDAANADRLRQDPIFQKAVLDARSKALEELATINATDVDKIRDAQARVRAISDLTTAIAAIILRGTAKRKNPGV